LVANRLIPPAGRISMRPAARRIRSAIKGMPLYAVSCRPLVRMRRAPRSSQKTPI
jgi:hypothetical protein